MKSKTLDQVRTAQARAVRFAQNVLGDDDLADEFESLSPEEYAERKHISIVSNPAKKGKVKENPPTLRERKLLKCIRVLKQKNAELEKRLDRINSLTLTDDK